MTVPPSTLTMLLHRWRREGSRPKAAVEGDPEMSRPRLLSHNYRVLARVDGQHLRERHLGRIVQVEARDIEHALLEPQIERFLRLHELRERLLEIAALDIDDRGAPAVPRRQPRNLLPASPPLF